jgi:hypothetical protein
MLSGLMAILDFISMLVFELLDFISLLISTPIAIAAYLLLMPAFLGTLLFGLVMIHFIKIVVDR